MNNWPVLSALLCCLILIGCDNKNLTEIIVPHIIKTVPTGDNNTEKLRVFPVRVEAGNHPELAFKRIGESGTLMKRSNPLDTMFIMPENLFISLDRQNASYRP